MGRRLPPWLTKRYVPEKERQKVENLLKEYNINTVCRSAECPNQGECFSQDSATFMILGDICSRNCGFCAVKSGSPELVDEKEIDTIVKAAKKLKLQYVVITSVTRDDLADKGVGHFIEVVHSLKQNFDNIKIELLTPDFLGETHLIKRLSRANFEVFNHNIETVPSLYPQVRAEASYSRSLKIIARMNDFCPEKIVKSGLMLGLGEKYEEVIIVMQDLIDNGCDILTIGQYLSPSENHPSVKEFIKPEKFESLQKEGLNMGFKEVIAGPFVRSSYRAREAYDKVNALK